MDSVDEEDADVIVVSFVDAAEIVSCDLVALFLSDSSSCCSWSLGRFLLVSSVAQLLGNVLSDADAPSDVFVFGWASC